jgi:predicted O-methyltransferase YrrM
MVSDIGEHLKILKELGRDKKILELGVRQGESTKAFLETCRELTSVDRDDCAKVANDKKWLFIKGDSLKVTTRLYSYDIVFIDTSHRYQETLDELYHYENRINPGGMIILHDANPPLKAKLRGRGGVLRAVLRFMNENPRQWNMTYYENNNGLAILRRREWNQ